MKAVTREQQRAIETAKAYKESRYYNVGLLTGNHRRPLIDYCSQTNRGTTIGEIDNLLITLKAV